MGADIDLRLARREAERDMRDKIKVTRASGTKTWNETTGEWAETEDTIYSGKGRLKSPRSAARSVEAGAQLIVVSHTEIQLPVDSDDLRAGDIALITECPDRPKQVGRRFRIVGPFDGSQTTALRFRVEAVDPR